MFTPMTPMSERRRIRNERENMEHQAALRALVPARSGRKMAFLSRFSLLSLPRRRRPVVALMPKSLAKHA